MRQSYQTVSTPSTCSTYTAAAEERKQSLTAQKDENVFDISQGVCILLCVKESDKPAPAKVYYTDLWGSREEKYNTLSETDVQSTEWCELQPTSSYYLFVPQATDYSAEYENGWEITDIFFHIGSVGIATGRDRLTIHRTAEDVRETVTDFVLLSVDEARENTDYQGILEIGSSFRPSGSPQSSRFRTTHKTYSLSSV